MLASLCTPAEEIVTGFCPFVYESSASLKSRRGQVGRQNSGIQRICKSAAMLTDMIQADKSHLIS